MRSLIAASLLIAGPATAAADRPRFTSSPSPDRTAAVRVDASRTGEPISRRLFGKFTEHLHRNIYHGMWAQVMRNPSFEAWHWFFSSDERLEQERDKAAAAGEPWPEGVAAQWQAEGRGEVTYRLDPDCVNSNVSQHIEITSFASAAIGVRQDEIYLPLHRVDTYDVSFYARSRGIDTVTLTVRDDERSLATAEITVLTPQWKRYRTQLTIREPVDKGVPLSLAITASTVGELWLDQLTVFPQDHVRGFDADVVACCRDARLPLLRYPGGNFASGYHWRDGVGPIDRRPMRRNPAWHCPEYNHVGTDEFLAFCEVVGCEPMICVNAGDGTVEEAAAWVEYCNAPVESRFGGMRARNGHPRPYDVRLWEIGNEIYGAWQLGHCTAEVYAERYASFVDAMRRVDPTIEFIANGHNPEWHAPLLKAHPALVRSFSLHPLIGASIPRDAEPANVWRSLMAYPTWYRDWLDQAALQMADAGVEPRFAVTELQIFTNTGELPNNSTLAEAVYMARYFHTAIRLGGQVELITHSALVNHGGGLRKIHGVVYAQPSWWATHLYSTMDDAIPVEVDVRTPVYDVTQTNMPTVEDTPYIDIVALTDADRASLTLMIVNTHPTEAIATTIRLTDWPKTRVRSGRRITGESFMAKNELDPPDRVTIRKIEVEPGDTETGVQYRVPPASITELTFGR